MAEGSDGKRPRVEEGMNDATENPARSARPGLIQPKIEHISDVIIASQGGQFEETEGKRSEAPGSGRDPRGSAHILMEDAAVDDITRQTELPRPVAVLELGQIHEVVCRLQPDLGDRRHPKQRTRPNKAVAPAIARIDVERHIFYVRLR